MKWMTSFLLFALFPSLAQAGAWVRQRGETYSKLSVSHFSSDEIYEHSGNRKINGPEFTDNSLFLYAEHGITNDWTTIASVEFKSLQYESTGTVKTTHNESGPGDLWLFAKRGLMKDPFVLSAQFGVKIPLGYDEKNFPPLGEGQIDLETRLLIGKSFYPFPAYGSAEVGYRKRNGDFSDVIPFLAEAGVYARRNILIKLVVDGISNLTNDRAGQIGVERAPNVFDKEYMKLSPALIFFGPMGYSMEIYYETFLSGANTAAGNTIGLGIAWQGFLFHGEGDAVSNR